MRPLPSLIFLLIMALSMPIRAESGEKTEIAPGEAKYLPLKSFVVNLKAEGRRMHFMQVSVQVMTRDDKVAKAIEDNMPPVRDALLMLLAHQSRETMSHVEGRERIRREAQGAIQQVLADVAGIEEGVNAVYFTDFVVQ